MWQAVAAKEEGTKDIAEAQRAKATRSPAFHPKFLVEAVAATTTKIVLNGPPQARFEHWRVETGSKKHA